jgi:hypothetical protein
VKKQKMVGRGLEARAHTKGYGTVLVPYRTAVQLYRYIVLQLYSCTGTVVRVLPRGTVLLSSYSST